jgi:hypothetical protein
MLLHPYFLVDLGRQRQAELLAEAAHQSLVDEALTASKAAVSKIARRQVRIVPTPTWSRHQPNLAMRTDMPA